MDVLTLGAVHGESSPSPHTADCAEQPAARMEKQAPPAYPGSNPGGYPDPYAGTSSTIVTLLPAPALGSKPCTITCPHCNNRVTTEVEYTNSSRTHLFALLLCIICPLGCCLIPYCVDSCKAAVHKCPSCHQNLGVHNS